MCELSVLFNVAEYCCKQMTVNKVTGKGSLRKILTSLEILHLLMKGRQISFTSLRKNLWMQTDVDIQLLTIRTSDLMPPSILCKLLISSIVAKNCSWKYK